MIRNILIISLIFSSILLPFNDVIAQSSSCSAITSSNYSDCCPSTVYLQTDTGQLCQKYEESNNLHVTRYWAPTPDNTSTNGTNTGSTPTTTTGLSGGGQYSPQVQLQFGSNGSFGGLTFKGVGAALVSCSGFGTFLAGVTTSAVSKVTGAIIGGVKKVGSAVYTAATKIPGIGSAVSAVGKLFSSSSKPGDSDSHPIITKASTTDPLVQKAACLDGIAYVLSQQVLQQITNRTLHWANTGFNGNPLYIRNIDSYLLSIRNQQLNAFLQVVPSSNPIFGNAIRSVITQQVTGLSDGLLNKQLNTPQAQAYNNFTNDFTNGGWDALVNPNFNPIGALFNATDTLTLSINNAKQNTQNELQRNQGFLDMKSCVQYANNGQVNNSTTNGSGLSGSNTPTCLKYETVTPGSIVALQVSNITNSPTRQAELATQFNQAVGSFFDALLNQLFSRGLSGIKGTANQADLGLDYGGLGSNTVLGTNGEPLSGINDGVADINSIAAGASGTLDISRPQLLRAVLKTQYDYLNRSTDADIVLGHLIPEMGKLDYCLPGPNPSWQDSLSDNFTTFLTKTNIPVLGVLGSINTSGLSLYDKVSDTDQPIGTHTFPAYNILDTKAYLQSVYSALTTNFNDVYSINHIANAYAATQSGAANQSYALGMAINAYNEVSDLPTFAQNVISADQQYVDQINQTQSDIQQLEAINNQVEKIVATAKARYVAAQKAAGTPVNQACIDAAYNVDTSAITGVARQESNTVSPIIGQSNDATTYFYNNL